MSEAGATSEALERRRELKRRVLTAAILAPLALAIAWFGGILFQLLLLASSLIIFLEWRRIVGHPAWAIDSYLPVAILLLVCAALVVGGGAWATAVLIVGIMIAAVVSHLRGRGPWLALGGLYAGAFFLGMTAVRGDGAAGATAILWLLLLVWATDTAAYFVGRRVGGPKLWPRVSPSKTWSGAFGGLGGSVVIAIGVWAIGQAGPLFPFVVLTIVIAIVSIGGDLMESAVKRRFKVKDASRLIPGHGGLMDRVDSLIAASLVCALIGLARGGRDIPTNLLVW